MAPVGDVNLVMSRPFSAGAFDFFIGSPDPDLTELANELFRDLPTPVANAGDFALFVLTESTDSVDNAHYVLAGPVVGSMSGLPLAGAVTMLVAAVSRASLDADPERLHLHAAGAVRGNRAAVLAAPRETGKTTTVATLVRRGWELISDEAISIGPGDEYVRGFAKPLSIKPGGRNRVPHLDPHLLPRTGVTDDAVLHASVGATGAEVRSGARPHLVVLLRRSRDAEPEGQPFTRPMHPADAAVQLMTETMDAGRFGPYAAFELARLAARCRCHEVVVGDPEKTAETIERLFDEPAVSPLGVRELCDGTAVNPNVVSVLVGDRTVIHEQPEGRILALDEPGTEVWLKLGGWASGEDINLNGPVVAPFVQQLESLGLIDMTSLNSTNGTPS